VGQL